MDKISESRKASEIISKLVLVENVNKLNLIKQAGQDINFCACEDEAAKRLIRAIPEMYTMLRIVSYGGDLEDVKDYLAKLEGEVQNLLRDSVLNGIL